MLDRYPIFVFPKEKINHCELGTPFVMCEDNIFERKLNRNMNKHMKKGLGMTFDKVECSHHEHIKKDKP